jgi:uncharacterized protein
VNLDFPFTIDGRGQSATAADDEHVRDMIEQVLFTSPGERVNRPTFGSGVLQLVFVPNSEELAATVQMQVHGALQQWLGDLIEVEEVEVAAEDAILRVRVVYLVQRTQQRQMANFALVGVAP